MVVGSLMCASEKENMVVESPLSSVKIRSGRFSTCNRARLLSVEDGQARVELDYRVNGPIRNCEFLIWAKGEGGVSPSRTPIFKK